MRQVDETHVEVRYVDKVLKLEGTSSQVLAKLRDAAGSKSDADSA